MAFSCRNGILKNYCDTLPRFPNFKTLFSENQLFTDLSWYHQWNYRHENFQRFSWFQLYFAARIYTLLLFIFSPILGHFDQFYNVFLPFVVVVVIFSFFAFVLLCNGTHKMPITHSLDSINMSKDKSDVGIIYLFYCSMQILTNWSVCSFVVVFEVAILW